MIAIMSAMPLVGDQGDGGGVPPHAFHYGLIAIAAVGLAMVGYAHLRGIHDAKKTPTGRADQRTSVAPMGERLLVPAALVSSAAAAGVHAAMAPAHFRETMLFGVFFVCAALLQVAWACRLMVRGGASVLVWGALGNIGVLAVWAVTRTVGLPFGLLPEPEAVGAWDLACGLWELVVVACCVLLLRCTGSQGQVAWGDWHRSARVYAGGSVVLLAAMAAGGAT